MALKSVFIIRPEDEFNRTEIGQLIVRLLIIIAFIIILIIRHIYIDGLNLYFYQPLEVIALITAFLALLISSILLGYARKMRNISVKRRIIASWLDAIYITLLVTNCNQIGVLSVGLYFWVIFGNGFRFGTKYLYHSQAVSFIGFLIGSNFSQYWEDIADIKYCFLIMIAVLPFYVSMLLKVIQKEKQTSIEASMAKSNFIASISHEIRTPLAGIMGIATLLKNPNSEEDKNHLLKILDSSSKILMSLLNNVLDISKIEEDKMVMEYSNFSLNNMLTSTVEIFEGQSATKNIRLEVNPLPDDIKVNGCMVLVQQVLNNLIGNAIKFTNKGVVTASMQLINTEDDVSLIRFEVLDSGIGITKEFQGKLFDRFSQSRESDTRMYGGSGLGLYISNKIVNAIGSQLKVISQEGLGSKFYFDVGFKLQKEVMSPLIQPVDMLADINNDSINITSSQKLLSFKNKKNKEYLLNILLCEDDHVNQQVTTRLLELPGHSVMLAKDSDEFLDLLERFKFDVVISDLNIPGKSGIESLKLYRFINPTDKHTKFIMLSAEATKEAIEEANDANFNKFLTKPVDISSLYRAIAEVKDFPSEAVDKWMRSILTKKNKKSVKLTGSIDQLKLIELEMIGESDPDFIALVINTYLQDALELIRNIELNLKSKKYSHMKNCCHALKGISGVIGANLIVNELSLIEESSTEELLFRGSSMIIKLNAEYQQVKIEIEHYLMEKIAS